MDISDIDSRLNLVKPAGLCLNLQERMQLDLALCELNNTLNCDELLFWGKISGPDKGDYFIAQCNHFVDRYEFPDKQFYWASSKDFKFTLLPETLEQHNEFTEMSSPFTGDPAHIIQNLELPKEGEGDDAAEENKAEGEGEEDELDSSSEDEAQKIPPKNFTELDRLSFTVKAIENDCQIVPLGSVKLIPKHEVRRNEAFKGLSAEEALDLKSYIHFRSARSEAKRELNEQDDAIFRPDFLESISDDPVHGSWSIQLDTTKSQTTARSLLWPGYVAFHTLNSKVYGGVYIGTGVKNADLPFML